MLIAFVGPPCSGKTTTAARLFATLKEQGLPAEFLSEYARMYIALKRHLEGDCFAPLDDQDQSAIMQEQEKHEAHLASTRDSIVIADSSAISALLYMTDPFIEREKTRVPPYGHPNLVDLGRIAAARYDVVFRCSPVKPGLGYDPNRVHSYEQSVELEKRMDRVYDLVSMSRSKVVPLFGLPKDRASEAAAVVMQKYLAQQVSAT